MVPVCIQVDVEVMAYDGARWGEISQQAEVEIGRLVEELANLGVHVKTISLEDWCTECGYSFDDTEEGCDDCVDFKVEP